MLPALPTSVFTTFATKRHAACTRKPPCPIRSSRRSRGTATLACSSAMQACAAAIWRHNYGDLLMVGTVGKVGSCVRRVRGRRSTKTACKCGAVLCLFAGAAISAARRASVSRAMRWRRKSRTSARKKIHPFPIWAPGNSPRLAYWDTVSGLAFKNAATAGRSMVSSVFIFSLSR
jgi:hypothetical protein